MKHKNERGFTLIELVVALALSTIIMGIAAGLIVRVVGLTQAVPGISSAPVDDRALVVRQLQNAGFWVTSDVLKSQSVKCNDTIINDFTWYIGSGNITLRWMDWSSGNTTRVAYNTSTDAAGLNELWRYEQLYDTGNNPVGNEMASRIAQYLESSSSCQWNSTAKVLTLNVTACLGGERQNRIYTVKARPF